MKIRKNLNPSLQSDEWLDEEKPLYSKRAGLKKTKKKKDVQKNPSEQPPSNGVVIQVHPNLCHVLLDENQETILCHYKRSLFHEEASSQERRDRTPFAVGDRVTVEKKIGEPQGILLALEKRKNRLFRISPERDQKTVQVLASNIDVLLIVASVKDPPFSSGFIDRFLVAAQSEKIKTVLIINKFDLYDPFGAQPWQFYKKELHVDFLEVSATTGLGIGKLSELIQGKTVLLCGHSGVGKTSLLNQLLQKQKSAPALLRKVGTLNEFTKKGKHTTTSALLMKLSQDTALIDTPGVRSFGIGFIPKKTLLHYFPELKGVKCKQGCEHEDNTEGCGFLKTFRGKSYLKILKEFEEEE